MASDTISTNPWLAQVLILVLMEDGLGLYSWCAYLEWFGS